MRTTPSPVLSPVPSPVTDPAPRADARLAWARKALADPAAELQRASTDAGFRSYWRTSMHAGASRIVMDSPPDREDVRPWLAMHDVLAGSGVRVPGVLARDLDAGFLLLEDLGTDTCLQVVDEGNADAMFDAAVTQLLKLQAIRPPASVASYDRPMLMRELHLFDDWFLGCHLGLSLDTGQKAILEQAYQSLVDTALAQPQVLVHRDFMPRNLMPVQGGVAVLDFQDAVRGPIAYDPICLFKDAFMSWPEARVDTWLGQYHARARAAGLPVPERERFRRDADWIGMQRHLKVIGIFARLKHRDSKPKYLADAPRFFDYLDTVMPRYPELQPLHQLLAQTVKPAIDDLESL